MGQYAYAYDPVGNRTQKQHTTPGQTETEIYTYTPEGEGTHLLETGPTRYTYNTSGSP